MTTNRSFPQRIVWSLLILFVILSTSGCVGAAAQLMYMIKGVTVEAEYDGLRGKRVAVVCVSGASQYGADHSSEMLARFLEATLSKQVKGIKLVHQNEVLDWIDKNDWDRIDFTQIGKGVNAERLVAVELSSYRLNNGQTLYQGRASVTVSVYDIAAGGQLVFRKTLPQFEYPQNGGLPTTDTTRARFEQKFIYMLSQQVANYFYDYELINDFGQDAAIIGQ